MADSKFEWNPGAEDHLRRMAEAALQPQVNRMAQEVIRQVNEEMAGASSEEVLAVLDSRLRQAGAQPDTERLREYAEAISNRTLR